MKTLSDGTTIPSEELLDVLPQGFTEEELPSADLNLEPPNGVLPAPEEPKWWSPLKRCDFLILIISTSLAESTDVLRQMMLVQWLYEETGSSMDLGYLGLVMLCAHIPTTLYGGVLADLIEPKRFISCAQTTGALTSLVISILLLKNSIRPWHLYLSEFFTAMVPPALTTLKTQLFSLTDAGRACSPHSLIALGR
jgi:hypothetical protein